MSRGKVIAIVVIVAAAIAWYAFRPERLVVNKTVNESFPVAANTSRSTPTSPVGGNAPSAMPVSGSEAAVVEYSGRFHGVAHDTNGVASVYKVPDGREVLRLTGFETSNGPDVHVYLVAANDATDSDSVKKAGFIELGSLKGNKGDQNYDLPANVDLSTHRAVTIWCKRFGVNFGTAPLEPKASTTPVSYSAPELSGQFHAVAHNTSGMASVYRLPDGRQILRLSNFETSNGPDVHVYLIKADDAADSAAVTKAGFIELGSLKGNKGDQNYDLPANVDLSTHRAVTIWCKRFSVNFGTAPLAPPESAPMTTATR